ncbi:type II CAAX endopeptidase family protein [Desulfosporosinus sp. FKA]|uniref:CPBP family intramembrane glutamic endopeptidase n=1 Tax=Desulfosporosinus sp. FKA TaxID=1969834 RepID=UPI001556E556|nr:type II CAAX endopeptidase family protein [Desulfosporosinus sp. FKA]
MKEIDNKLKQNTIFTQSAISKLKFNIFMIIITYFFLWLVGLFIGRLIGNFIINVLTTNLSFDKSLIFLLKKLIVCGTQISFFFVWVRFVEKRPIKTIGFQSINPLKSYTIGFLLGFISISTITAILAFWGMVAIKSFNVNFAPLLFGSIALGWIVQSASEEIAIRGWLIPLIGNRSTPIIAIVLTSMIFGILHLFSSGVTVLSFVNLVLSGVFFAGYAIYSNNIWGVCGLHFSWNLSLGNIYGFPVSGFSSYGETILTMKPVGSVFFTGGDFGPEGGFVTTVILLIGIVILSLKILKKYSVKYV